MVIVAIFSAFVSKEAFDDSEEDIKEFFRRLMLAGQHAPNNSNNCSSSEQIKTFTIALKRNHPQDSSAVCPDPATQIKTPLLIYFFKFLFFSWIQHI